MYQAKTDTGACSADQSAKQHLLLQQPTLGISLGIGTPIPVWEPSHQESIWVEQLILWHANYAQGKDAEEKERTWNFHWLQVTLPKAVSEDEWSNEAQSRQPFLGLPQSPHPLAQILAAQHHLRLHQQGVQGRKTWGVCSFLFPSLRPCAFCLSLLSSLDPVRSQVAKFSCAGAALIKPAQMLPSLWYGEADFGKQRQSSFQASGGRGVSSEPWGRPGVCGRRLLLLQHRHCCGLCWLGRLGRRRGAESFALLAASHALSALPVPCYCPLHQVSFPAA